MYLPEEYSRLICAPCTPIAIRSSLRFFFSFLFSTEFECLAIAHWNRLMSGLERYGDLSLVFLLICVSRIDSRVLRLVC